MKYRKDGTVKTPIDWAQLILIAVCVILSTIIAFVLFYHLYFLPEIQKMAQTSLQGLK